MERSREERGHNFLKGWRQSDGALGTFRFLSIGAFRIVTSDSCIIFVLLVLR